MLTKRTYSIRISLVSLLLAALLVPAVALAASGGGADSGERIGLAPAQPAPPFAAPGRQFQHAIRVAVRRIRIAQHRRELRRRHAREADFATLPGGVSLATLDAIGECESGGDPTAVSADGTYRGKYQFDYGTWESVGGTGDPAAASEAEQDYRAALLYAEAGSSPWPICG